jgi:co-chaperonin GroES (HSP10)
MILSAEQLPAAPSGHRIIVLADPPPEDSSVIITPDDQKHRPHVGRILAAGITALDTLHDHGHQIGDRIWWGKFAGVLEEWDRITEATKKAASCEHTWIRDKAPYDRVKVWKCDHCLSTRRCDAIGVMNVDDILANESLARRLENGEVAVQRGQTATGKTQHFIDRKDR